MKVRLAFGLAIAARVVLVVTARRGTLRREGVGISERECDLAPWLRRPRRIARARGASQSHTVEHGTRPLSIFAPCGRSGVGDEGSGPRPCEPPKNLGEVTACPDRQRKLTDQEREQRRRRDRDRLEHAAREMLSSEGWKRWVRVRSTTSLGRYTLRNQWLIAAECARRGIIPTHVAGFRAWLALNRVVRKGERTIYILARLLWAVRGPCRCAGSTAM